jgi:hypothetical protein
MRGTASDDVSPLRYQLTTNENKIKKTTLTTVFTYRGTERSSRKKQENKPKEICIMIQLIVF